MENIKAAGIVLLSAAFLGIMVFGGWQWQKFRFEECLKVGHSKTYCYLSK